MTTPTKSEIRSYVHEGQRMVERNLPSHAPAALNTVTVTCVSDGHIQGTVDEPYPHFMGKRGTEVYVQSMERLREMFEVLD